MPLPPATEPRDEDIARLCRQICLCRTRGQAEEASRFEIMLRHRVSTGFSEDVLQEIFSAEQRRVIDALMLAELLGPILTEKLADASSSGRVSRTAPAKRNVPSSSPAGSPPDIADLIEGMLDQERNARSQAA